MHKGHSADLIHGSDESDATCWYVLGAVLMLSFLMTCLLYYQKFCYCFMKKERLGFIDLQVSGNHAGEGNMNDIQRIECCSFVILLNRRFNPCKLVFIKDGEKTIYNSMDDSPSLHRMTFNNTCVICLEEFTSNSKLIRLTCLHGYHKMCIRQWIVDKKDSKCPLCLSAIHSETITVGGSSIDDSPLYAGDVIYPV